MKNLFLFTLIMLVVSCQQNNGTKEKEVRDLKALKKEVLAIHDEVMPKMGDLRRARKSLMLRADSMMSQDSVKAKSLLAAANELAEANEGMMQWMRQYEPQLEGAEDSLWNYYSQQKKLIDDVSASMNRELKEANEILSTE